jgi:hypothetical protein
MNEREFEGKAAESLENETLRCPASLSFRGAAGDEESRNSFDSRAKFLPLAPLRVGITGFTKVFQHPVREAVAVLRR